MNYMMLYEISEDKGKTWSEQLLFANEAVELAEKYFVRLKGSDFLIVPPSIEVF